MASYNTAGEVTTLTKNPQNLATIDDRKAIKFRHQIRLEDMSYAPLALLVVFVTCAAAWSSGRSLMMVGDKKKVSALQVKHFQLPLTTLMPFCPSSCLTIL